MPGVSPELSSTVSGVNPSQLQPRLQAGAELLCWGLLQHLLRVQPFNPLVLRNVNGIAECCDYFAFALSRYRAVKMHIAVLREAGPLRDTEEICKYGCGESQTATLTP